MKSEQFVANHRLRRARLLKGWSQSELAEQVGTSFEMVSRWERGITLPSPYYRGRLCAALGKSAQELDLMSDEEALTAPASPVVLLACGHQDTEKAIVSHLKGALQERGITFWSSRQLSRQGSESSPAVLREVLQSVQVILLVLSPQARSSRHVREALELARGYQRAVCAVWIEGEHWQECLPKGHDEVAALIDARGREDVPLLEELAVALQRLGLAPQGNTVPSPTQAEPSAALIPSSDPLQQGSQQGIPPAADSFEPTPASLSLPKDMPLLPTSAILRRRKGAARSSAVLLIGLAMLVIAAVVLASMALRSHVGTPSPASPPVRGGSWTEDYIQDPDSLLPNRGGPLTVIHQALYLPLFYGDALGVVHPGAATEVPSLQNGGISPDAKTWTFHLRPHLLWSDGHPYDAGDVDFTWKLWLTPGFDATNRVGLNLIGSADVSADSLSITFHLKQPFAPFLGNLWVDGFQAPLPAHHFRGMTPEAILKSPDNLNPTVTSGPFMMAESKPGDHYTLASNPRYYRASEGLPYLDKVVFRIVADDDAVRKDLQAGTVDSALVDPYQLQVYQRFPHYRLVTLSSSSNFEAIYFNFHNTVLASHLEVRQAIAMAIDHQALIEAVPGGFATKLCTDHPSAIHPGYQPTPNCPIFNPAAANKLLDDSGWAKGPQGVRARDGERLEFEYSTSATFNNIGRASAEVIVQRNLRAIGIQLDIQNYPHDTFFGPFLNGGKASPATGAVAGRYDIAEWEQGFGYDPDDSFVLGCDQVPPKGINWTFYCNPALDALYRQEQATVDPGVRQQLFNQIHQIYLTQFPFIVLYSSLDPSIVRKGTHNYQPSPIEGETVNIWEWWCDGGKC